MFRVENRFFIEPRWRLGHLLHGFVNGDNLVQLTNHPSTDRVSRLLAGRDEGLRSLSERDITHDLYVMDSDGSNIRNPTHP